MSTTATDVDTTAAAVSRLDMEEKACRSAFGALQADDDIDALQATESLCMHCFEKDGEERMGVTRYMATSIPYFRQILVMSFECPHCHFRSSELQTANEIQPTGVRYRLDVDCKSEDCKKQLNRQAIKSETASIFVPEIAFEIPASNKKGEINTVEGFLSTAADNIEAGQEARKEMQPEVVEPLQNIINHLRDMAEGRESFTFIMDDISGNSFLENPYAPSNDRCVTYSRYGRTVEQNEALGLESSEEEKAAAVPTTASMTYRDKIRISKHVETRMLLVSDIADRGVVIPGECHCCHLESETRMVITEIPYFKQLLLMVTECVHCGYRDSEIKPAGEIGEHGTKHTLTVGSAADLARDVMKSDSASISIPELDLELDHGTLGGKYTTVEGLIGDIIDQLRSASAFHLGDSSLPEEKDRVTAFFQELEECHRGERKFTFIVDDPLANSFIGKHDVFAQSEEEDPRLTIEKYLRSQEQNELFGLNDIRVEPEQYLDEQGLEEFRREAAASSQAEVSGPDTLSS